MTIGSDLTGTETSGLAHRVEVDKLILSNHLGQNVDIKAVFSDITLESSIFEPGIKGAVRVYDAHAMITRLPIIGQETLFLEFKTPGNFTKKGEYSVWKVADEEPDDKGGSTAYTLHFCSKEFVKNASQIVARSFTNTDDCHSIVDEIQSKSLVSSKKLKHGKSRMKDPNNVLVIPLYKPFEAIDMVVRRAYSGQSKSDYYLYFERHDFWYLGMLEDLIEEPINRRLTDQRPNRGDQLEPNVGVKTDTVYNYASTKFVDDNINANDYNRIIRLRINHRFDSLQKISNGMHDNEIVEYSINDKTVIGKNFDQLSQGKTVVAKKPSNTDEYLPTISLIDAGLAGTQGNYVSYVYKGPDQKSDAVRKPGGLNQHVRTSLNQMMINIVVPGDTSVDIGDVVTLNIPKFEGVLSTSEQDEQLSGKWLVGAIRDSIIVPDKHVMTMDLYRDGHNTSIGESVMFKEKT